MIRQSVSDNLAALDQGLQLLRHLPPERYGQRVEVCFNSAIGGHLRHIVDHYLSFLAGVESGRVDYESRARDPRLETDAAYALQRLQRLVADLAETRETLGEQPLWVRVETAGDTIPDPWTSSSVVRELEFLLSHTVHHYALIAVLCGLLGAAVPGDFGVAPSTLRYRQTRVAACAR